MLASNGLVLHGCRQPGHIRFPHPRPLVTEIVPLAINVRPYPPERYSRASTSRSECRAPTQRAGFCLWPLRYRRQSRPFLMEAIARYAGHATLHIIRNLEPVRRFFGGVPRNREAAEPLADK
jgi:hypothetical protein